MDEYFKEIYSFNVLGHDIAVADERIGEALKALPTDKRDIILLSGYIFSLASGVRTGCR